MSYLLIWDIDGTLVNSRSAGRKAMNSAFYDLYGIENAFEKVRMAGMLDTNILIDVYRANSMLEPDGTFTGHRTDSTIFSNEKERFFSVYCKILEEELQKLNTSIAASGIQELFQTLGREASFFHALGTGNIEKGARLKLAVDNLNGFFPVGGFGDIAAERWEMVQKAIQNAQHYYRREFLPVNTYVIGDTPIDIECGKKLGCKTIGVATGPFSVQQLTDCHADYVFKDFSDTGAFLSIFV